MAELAPHLMKYDWIESSLFGRVSLTSFVANQK